MPRGEFKHRYWFFAEPWQNPGQNLSSTSEEPVFQGKTSSDVEFRLYSLDALDKTGNSLTCHQRRPCGGAGGVDIVVGQADCVRRQRVQVWRHKNGIRIAEADIRRALVVC